MSDRLTQELRAIIEPLGVRLDEQETYERPLSHKGDEWLTSRSRYRLPGILTVAITQTSQGTPCVLCWPKRRCASLTHTQLSALEALLKRVREPLPPWIPEELLSIEVEAEREIALAALRLEPTWHTPHEVARLIAAAPVLVLTRDALESLCISIRCRLARLDYEEAHCFYAVEPGYLQGVHHLMLPSGRTLRHPALCGAPAPTSEPCYAPHWWLFPVPAGKEPGQGERSRSIPLCADCLARWQAMQAAKKENTYD